MLGYFVEIRRRATDESCSFRK